MARRKDDTIAFETDLGRRIKRIRLSKGMTLMDVAKAVGCSVGLLSQIETGKVSPSLKTLFGIAACLRVPVGSLFDESLRREKPVFIKASERSKEATIFEGLNVENIVASDVGTDGEVKVVWATLEAGASTGEIPHTHPGKEIGIILKGKAEVVIGEERYQLGPGDSIYFQADIPHTWRNVGDEQVESIWVQMRQK